MPIRINFLFDTLRTLGSRVVYGSVLLFYAVCVQAGSVSLAWDANTEPNLSGYQLYYGQASGNYSNNVDVHNQTTYTVPNLLDGKTYFFAVKAYGYDSAGQRIESGFSNEVSTTVGTPPPSTSCNPCTIWGETVPGGGPDSEQASLELGVKFKSDIDGYVTGIRFYKASTNTGTHTGTLWDSNGNQLATATFTNETASGWQQVNFATPVPITANTNTVYVASYHTNTGHYNDTPDAFSGKGVDNGPLHALADGAAGPNGVYAYGSGSSFPTQTWHSSNYWVDVIFKTP